ncbi:nucleophosmin-like [Drosophila grimshawi]|uniref:nucleophosmin-like n=1 Tax=Drosophila grimshawi TaxID=7222 RepID=UPI001C933C76|nr:nucleophosmin-like [Drosophila grimshawi]
MTTMMMMMLPEHDEDIDDDDDDDDDDDGDCDNGNINVRTGNVVILGAVPATEARGMLQPNGSERDAMTTTTTATTTTTTPTTKRGGQTPRQSMNGTEKCKMCLLGSHETINPKPEAQAEIAAKV